MLLIEIELSHMFSFSSIDCVHKANHMAYSGFATTADWFFAFVSFSCLLQPSLSLSFSLSSHFSLAWCSPCLVHYYIKKIWKWIFSMFCWLRAHRHTRFDRRMVLIQNIHPSHMLAACEIATNDVPLSFKRWFTTCGCIN